MLQNYVAYHLLAGFTHFYVYDVSQKRSIRWDFMPASACVAGTIALIDQRSLQYILLQPLETQESQMLW
jgi:hypothetical protein